MLDISKTWISINCPKCNYSFEIQLQDAELESTLYCHNCKQSIQLVDSNASAARGIKSIEDAFDDLNNTLNNLFK
jgi:transcription elongation factor Elf1